MIHLGVDLHQRFCYLTALDARGKQLQAGAVANEAVALRRYFGQFRGQGVEACGFWPAFREVVEPRVERLVLVHPQRVKAIASAKLQNDRVDSATLAHLLRCDLLPESWKAVDAGAAADAVEEPGARGAASAGAAFAGDRPCSGSADEGGWRG